MRFANTGKPPIFLVPHYEGIERRKAARDHRRPGDRSWNESSGAARRSARTDGPEWLRKEHAREGPGRSSRLPGNEWQDHHGRRKSPRIGARRKGATRPFPGVSISKRNSRRNHREFSSRSGAITPDRRRSTRGDGLLREVI